MQPQLTAEEPAFEPFWDATRTRTPVSFDYRTSRSASTATRHLQPWGVVSYRGRWYVAGHDTDRGEPRVFRLSRVQGEVRADGPGSFEVPPGTDLRAVTESLAPPTADRTAEVLVRQGAGHGLRRHAGPAPSSGGGRARLGPAPRHLRRGDAFADEVLGYGADVVVLGPEDVRANVVRRLRETAQRGRCRRERRARPGRPAAGPGALHPGSARGLAGPGGGGLRREPAQIVKDLNVLWFCGLPGSGWATSSTWTWTRSRGRG